MVCSVPSWRSDIYREVDLIEEVARAYGYDKIATESRIEIEVAPQDRRQKLTSALMGTLNGHGFYEAINIASAFDLPVVYVCENNLYGVGTRQGDVRKIEDVADRGVAYGIPGVVIDGNDVLAVYEAASEALRRSAYFICALRPDSPRYISAAISARRRRATIAW